jgi:hypothetical protein
MALVAQSLHIEYLGRNEQEASQLNMPHIHVDIVWTTFNSMCILVLGRVTLDGVHQRQLDLQFCTIFA